MLIRHRHQLSLVAAVVALGAVSTHASWRKWNDPVTAWQDITDAMRERLLAFSSPSISTVNVAVCVDGESTEIPRIFYRGFPMPGVIGDMFVATTQPINVSMLLRASGTGALAQYGTETQTWSVVSNTPSGAVTQEVIEVYPLYRVDSTGVITNDDCSVSTGYYERVTWTNLPGPSVNYEFVRQLDNGLSYLLGRQWLATLPSQFTNTPNMTNWYWNEELLRWKIDGYEYPAPPPASPLWELYDTAGLPVETWTQTVDRGISYPRTVTNRYFWGWQVGEFTTRDLVPARRVTSEIPRYLTNVVRRGLLRHTAASTQTLASLRSARSGGLKPLEATGFGPDVDGRYVFVSGPMSYYAREGGGPKIYSLQDGAYIDSAPLDPDESRTNAMFWIYGTEPGIWGGNRIIGCYDGPITSPPVTGQVRRVASWYVDTSGDITENREIVWQPPADKINSRLVVTAAEVAEDFCRTNHEPLLPQPITLDVVGDYWTYDEWPTQTGWRLVVGATQVVGVTRTGEIELAQRFANVLRLSPRGAWTGEYIHGGVHIVVQNVSTGSLASVGRLAWPEWKPAIEDRKKLLQSMKYRTVGGTVSNVMHAELNTNGLPISPTSPFGWYCQVQPPWDPPCVPFGRAIPPHIVWSPPTPSDVRALDDVLALDFYSRWFSAYDKDISTGWPEEPYQRGSVDEYENMHLSAYGRKLDRFDVHINSGVPGTRVSSWFRHRYYGTHRLSASSVLWNQYSSINVAYLGPNWNQGVWDITTTATSIMAHAASIELAIGDPDWYRVGEGVADGDGRVVIVGRIPSLFVPPTSLYRENRPPVATASGTETYMFTDGETLTITYEKEIRHQFEGYRVGASAHSVGLINLLEYEWAFP